MAENGSTETPKAAAPAQQPPQVRMQVLAQYIRDLSFENVMMQKGTGSGATPEVQVQVNIDARKRGAENQYEVVLKLKVTAKARGSEDTLFLMELDYGGIFMVDGVPEEQMHPYLLIECPRMLFPFVRRIVSDVSFVSLTIALAPVLDQARAGTRLVALIKPQFEAGRAALDRHGVVRDAAVRERVGADIAAWVAARGWRVLGRAPSPITGGDGNHEELIGAVRER